MKLFLEKITSSGGRVGRLVWCTESAQSVLETPLCLPYTRAGAIPHIVQSVYQDISPRPTAAMLTLPSLYELPGTAVLKEYDYGIHNFLNMKDQFLYLSIQDPHCPPRSGFNEEKSTSVWTNGGRMKVSVAGYVEFVRASRPNVFESLCDSVSSQTNKLKRIRKSVDRTLRFLDQTLAMRQNCQVLEECGLLGAVVGGDVYEERVRSATETAKRPVDGFVIEGFDLEHSHECYQSILQSSSSVLPQSSPRFIHGVYSPGDILTAVESGVDVFDSACVLTATESGCAFTFHNSWTSSSDCADERENRATENIATEPPSHQIDLNDEKYAMEFSPLVRGCECYCCVHHTRAYIHHLLITREILASTLLMMHNFTHLMKFFASLRNVLRSPLESDYLHFKSLCTFSEHFLHS